MLKFSTLALIFFSFNFASFAENTAPQIFHVAGMHCAACAKMIEGKVCQLEGIQSCSVEVGKITITSEAPVASEKVQAALSEAGEYKVVANAELAVSELPKESKKSKKSKKH